MPYTVQETITYQITATLTSVIAGIAAFVFTDSSRWFFVALSVSTMTAMFLSLRFKKRTESVSTAVGRGGLSIMLSIFGTRGVVHYWKMDDFNNDLMLLGMLSMLICIVSYFVGISILMALDTSSSHVGVVSLDMILKHFGLSRIGKSDDKDQKP